MAVIGIVAASATPLFLGFLDAQRLQGAAQRVATLLDEGRQLAIARNTSYQVQVDAAGNRLRFLRLSGPDPALGACPDGSNCWRGPGTDGNGWIAPERESSLAIVSGTNPTFSPLGVAAPIVTLRVRNLQATSCLDVIVSPSGRIRTAGAASCP